MISCTLFGESYTLNDDLIWSGGELAFVFNDMTFILIQKMMTAAEPDRSMFIAESVQDLFPEDMSIDSYPDQHRLLHKSADANLVY